MVGVHSTVMVYRAGWHKRVRRCPWETGLENHPCIPGKFMPSICILDISHEILSDSLMLRDSFDKVCSKGKTESRFIANIAVLQARL